MVGNVVRFPRPSELTTMISDEVLDAARALGSVAATVERAPLSLACKSTVYAELIAIGSRLKFVVETINGDQPSD
jgi:hypothetical protein